MLDRQVRIWKIDPQRRCFAPRRLRTTPDQRAFDSA
jgi:hypothetical protein